jgi:hypothetical protein
MTFEFPFTKKKLTAEEIEEQNELLTRQNENEELQLSIAQKQALRTKLESSGLTVKKDFGGSLKRAWVWLNKTK